MIKAISVVAKNKVVTSRAVTASIWTGSTNIHRSIGSTLIVAKWMNTRRFHRARIWASFDREVTDQQQRQVQKRVKNVSVFGMGKAGSFRITQAIMRSNKIITRSGGSIAA